MSDVPSDNALPLPVLEIGHPTLPPLQVTLDGAAAVIGRGTECSIRLDDAMVSRRHARLDRLVDGQWRVTDLHSHNGTHVNDSRIDTAVIGVDDQVRIGPFKVRLKTSPSHAATHTTTATVEGRLSVSDDAREIRSLREVEPPRLAVDQLRCLDEFSRSVLDMCDPDDRLVSLCRLMLDPCFGARWSVAVATPVVDEPRPLCPLQQPAGGHEAQTTRLSRSLLRVAEARGEPVIASNRLGEAADLGLIEMSVVPHDIGSAAVAVPFVTHDGRPGLLYATFPPQYGTGEWLALCSLAVRHHRQAEAVWANIHRNRKLAALEADLERGRRVQDRLVPKHCVLPGLDIAIRFSPCHGVGGDYVDALALPDGTSLVVIADVSGKGLAAALVAMGLHTIVHSSARRWAGLADLAAALDDHLVGSLSPDTFVTLIALTLDPTTGRIEWINAGHPPAVIFATDVEPREIGIDGNMMLGPFGQQFAIQRDRLGDNESLLLYTDGCFETFNEAGDMLGLSRMRNALHAPICTAPSAASATDTGIELLERWQGATDSSDDRTLLVIRRYNPNWVDRSTS